MEIIERDKDPGFVGLKGIIDARHKNEKDMAEQLLHAFEENTDILTLLRNHVKAGAEKIIELCNLKGGDVVFKKAYRDALNYDWVKSNSNLGDNYTKFKEYLKNEANIQSLGASQCSDIIRFFGEITEAAADFPKLVGKWIEANLNGSWNGSNEGMIVTKDLLYRGKFENFEIHKRGQKAVSTQKAYQRSGGVQHNEWGTFYDTTPDRSHWDKSKKSDGRRLRVPTKTDTVWLADEERMETLDEAKKRQGLVVKYKQEMTKCELAIVEMKGGVSRWMQLDNDTVNKMNRVFGLAHGATISGTTTDTLYFFDQVTAQAEYFGKMLPLSQRFNKEMIEPICYMLPLATIVGNGHHSTIEVALPLNLNLKDRFEYAIGRYKTLKPKGLSVKWGKISDILEKAQANAANNLVLIYYKQGSKDIEGYVKCDPDFTWDELSRGDARLISLFKKFPSHPTKRDIGRLHLKVNHALFAGKEDKFTKTTSVRERINKWENK